MMEMIKEWLLARILKNRVVFFENDGEYHLINDIYFDEGTVICSYYDRKSIDDEEVVDLLNKQDMMIESQTKQLQKQHKIIKEQDKRIIELEKENGELHLLIKEYEFAKKEGYGDAK